MLRSTGKPPPDHCGLRCKNGETCPTGTSCQMPVGICAFPYPMSEPEQDGDGFETFRLAPSPPPEPEPHQIVGQGEFRYVYEETKLQMPPGANPPYSHGVELDDDANLYLTYFDSADSGRCLLKWSPADGYTKYEVIGHGSEMCQSGDHSNGPHGLRISKEASGTYFYHANNNQALFKTTLEGKVLWSVYGNSSHRVTKSQPHGCVHGTYCPTWFGMQPDSDYVYMADGCAPLPSRPLLVHRARVAGFRAG